MKLLILGGTQFVGRHITEAALTQSHDVTLFNRGKTDPGKFDVEELKGDRDGGLDVLEGRSWDAVIDVSGYVPRLVRDSARWLADSVGHYTFVSTVSVYSDFSEVGIAESASLAKLDDPATEEVTGETYGGLKVLCEQAVAEEMGDRQTIVRPGIVVGPRDPTDRFTYWVVRAARGGPVLAPGRRDKPVQFIDGRDLAAFTLLVTGGRLGGEFNVVGPEKQLSMGAMLDECNRAGGERAGFEWVPESRLAELGAETKEFPLYAPEEYPGFATVSNKRALGAGLTIRELSETVSDTLAWARSSGRLEDLDAGPSPEREAELLAGLDGS